MNKERIKGIVIGFILCAALSSSVIVMANTRTETRQITYGIRVNFNGQLIQFDDDSQPFVMGGRTFLPLRAMADLLGLPVDFDPGTNTAYLGNRHAGVRTPLTQAAPHFDFGGTTGTRNFTAVAQDSVVMGGEIYNNALVLGRGGTSSTGAHGFTLHNLNGQFRMLTGYIGRMDGENMFNATIRFLGDGQLLESIAVNATDMPRPVSIFVEGITQLRIEIAFDGGRPVSYALITYLE